MAIIFTPSFVFIILFLSLFSRLACPGLWWRATIIALILCGKSPQKLGAEMWKASPTIKALIKMVTSGKFRFPTADCNEMEREEMRLAEHNIKQWVSVTAIIVDGCSWN